MRKLLYILLFSILSVAVKAEYDSLAVLSIHQKYAIPEDVDNGDYVDTFLITRTWPIQGAISFSIEQNFDDAFTINSSNGLITINDASDIDGQIASDTIIYLIIRTTDSGYGYELDTAEIWVEEDAACTFIDYSGGAGGSGTRVDPYGRNSDFTITEGGAYFYIRGESYLQMSEIFEGIYTSNSNPTIFGAYGAGSRPYVDGTGLSFNAHIAYVDANPLSDTCGFMDWYSWTVANYEGIAIQTLHFTDMGLYNMDFYDCDRTSQQAVIAFNTSEDDSVHSHPLEAINCRFDTVDGGVTPQDDANFLKIGTAPNRLINNEFGRGDPSENPEAGLRLTSGILPGNYVAHNYFQSAPTANWVIQLRQRYVHFYNNIIVGGDEGIYMIAPNATYANLAPKYCRFENNHIYGQGSSAIWRNGTGDATIGNVYIDNYLENTGGADYGIRFYDVTYDTIQRNIISGYTNGLEFVAEGVNPFITNNLFYGNTISINFNSGHDGFEVYNNVLDDLTGVFETGATGTQAFTNNYFISNSATFSSELTNIDLDTITEAYHFEDYPNNDYTLLVTGVSAIDNGTDVGLTYDFKGYEITDGSPDIGAYEYGATTPDPPTESTDWDTLRINLTEPGQTDADWNNMTTRTLNDSIQLTASDDTLTTSYLVIDSDSLYLSGTVGVHPLTGYTAPQVVARENWFFTGPDHPVWPSNDTIKLRISNVPSGYYNMTLYFSKDQAGTPAAETKAWVGDKSVTVDALENDQVSTLSQINHTGGGMTLYLLPTYGSGHINFLVLQRTTSASSNIFRNDTETTINRQDSSVTLIRSE